jgi:hypothetical protein
MAQKHVWRIHDRLEWGNLGMLAVMGCFEDWPQVLWENLRVLVQDAAMYKTKNIYGVISDVIFLIYISLP